MASVLTIIRGEDIVANVDSPDRIVDGLKGQKPGRFVVEESSLAREFLPSGYTCQRWGVALLMPDGSVSLEPEPAPVRP